MSSWPTTPPRAGRIAAATFAVLLIALPVGRLVGPDRLAVGAALFSALSLMTAGTAAQGEVYLLSGAVAGALVWLVCAAMTVRSGRWAAIGLTGGLGGAVALHALLDTVDLVWRTGPLPTLGLAVLACAFVGAVASAVNFQLDTTGRRAGVRGAVWLLAGPAIALTGMVTGATARADAAADAITDLPRGWASAGVSAAALLATALAARPRVTRHPALPALLLVAAVAASTLVHFRIGGISHVPASWTVTCQMLGALCLGAVLGWAGAGTDAKAAMSAPADSSRRRGATATIGALVLLGLVIAYYAADRLGGAVVSNAVPIAAAIAIALVSVRTGRRALRWGAPVGRPEIDAAVAATAVVAAGQSSPRSY